MPTRLNTGFEKDGAAAVPNRSPHTIPNRSPHTAQPTPLTPHRSPNTAHPTPGESTPLFMAAGLSKGSEDMVRLLLESRASVSARTNTGETPLHAALAEDVRFDFPDGTVRLLLEHGASLSATTRLGETPLHTAAENAWGHEAVVAPPPAGGLSTWSCWSCNQ